MCIRDRRIRSRAVRIFTTFGDIHFRGELFAGGKYELRSVNGNVDASVSGSFELEASTRRGRIETRVATMREAPAVEDKRVRGSFETAEGVVPAALEMSSVAGLVRVGLLSN